MRWLLSVPLKANGLRVIFREVFKHHGSGAIASQVLDELSNFLLIKLIRERVVHQELGIVHWLGRYFLLQRLGNAALSTGLWTDQHHALRQQSILGLVVDLFQRARGINVMHLAK